MTWPTRPALHSDAPTISEVILAALRTTNAKDYSAEILQRVALSFSPSAVLALINTRDVYVALSEDGIIGTASLDGTVIRTVFVAPAYQGKGVGTALMTAVEQLAIERGITRLKVPSSVTAEMFYRGLGFTVVREVIEEGERTIVMERSC
ncbi:GNAT family N-acetyltransferase [Pseudomonas sp. RIT-PI-S]|uniref:GNAT family N-acetyltransferase n=1 Tax=Pseudomonas sp. RIT-PI-S TaxID=3035295 RepID=UPI0021D83409|nr:GNAT family N-acetyltransferase [Pseudomonas sp. RIT-PI-S]